MSYPNPAAISLCLATVLFHAGIAGAQFEDLLRRLPGEAIALVVLNAETVFSSPLAVKEGWRQDYPKAIADAVLTSLRGATLGVRIGERAFGRLKVDFDRDASVLGEVAKPLILETLNRAGAKIDELETWNPRVEGKTVSIEGNLTASGLRRVFSFLELDALPVAVRDPRPTTEKPVDESTKPYASRQYFQAVAKYLRDLRGERDAKTMG